VNNHDWPHEFRPPHGCSHRGCRPQATAAEHGRYLRPIAKIMLAIAVMREKKPKLARAQLYELVAQFQNNQLFANELAKLKKSPAAATLPQY